MNDDLPTPELDPLEWTGLDAGQRTLRAQIAAQSRWAKPGNRKRQSEAISRSRILHHEKLVDPDGTLDPKERRLCAEASLKAEMTRLALEASKVRQAKKGAIQ